MDRVVILGAGELGGLIAHAAARRGVAQDICLIDEKGRVAEGKALDITQAAPVESFSARVTGSSDGSLGVPPEHVVVPWEDATAGGFAVSRLIGEPERRRLEAALCGLWPPGPYALASAAAKVIDTLLGRSERVVTCFVAPDDSAGGRRRTAALPARLNRSGLIDVVLPALNGRDRVRLENAIAL